MDLEKELYGWLHPIWERRHELRGFKETTGAFFEDIERILMHPGFPCLQDMLYRLKDLQALASQVEDSGKRSQMLSMIDKVTERFLFFLESPELQKSLSDEASRNE